MITPVYNIIGELSYLKNKLFTEQVQEQIYQYTPNTPIIIGARLSNEFELGEKLGASRSAIREAAKLLISRGILEVHRGSGTYVANTTPMDLDPLGLGAMEDKMALVMNLVNVRMVLEPDIAEVAIVNITVRGVEHLRELCAAIGQEIETGENYIEEDITFHITMVKCSGNMVMEQLVSITDTTTMMFVNAIHGKLAQETIMTHRTVADATAERDPTRAKSVMMTHMTFNKNMVKDMMKQ